MLGLGQTPVLAARPQYGFESLAEALLIALQLRDQTSTVFQLIGWRELRDACAQLLVILRQYQGLFGDILDLSALLLVPGLQHAQLPDSPAGDGDTGNCQQQGQEHQATVATAGALGADWLRLGCRRFQHRFFVFRQGCFAHVSHPLHFGVIA